MLSPPIALAGEQTVDPARVTPGLLGFLVVLALGLATWALLRSLNKQLKRVDFEEQPPRGEPPPPPPPPEPRPPPGAPDR